MSRFDRADAKLSAAIDRLHAESVEWLPMRPRGENRYVNKGSEPDPTRPKRTMRAAVTWSPGNMPAAKDPQQGSITFADCVLDFPADVFEREDEPGVFDLPRVGDRFRITEEYKGNNLVEVQKDGDDASERIYFLCRAVSEDE